MRHQVPIIITSLGAPVEAVREVHGYGGIVIHDVAAVRHAHKALEAGVDGLVLVSAGAGGHGGALNPFAFVSEVRRFYEGLILLSGGITTGECVLAAEVAGADFAYMGTRFIASREANCPEAYRQMVIDSTAADIVNSALFTGFAGNYLKGSIVASGMDPKDVATGSPKAMVSSEEGKALLLEIYRNGHAKAWRDIWAAGHGVGSIMDAPPAETVIARLKDEYEHARQVVSSRSRRLPLARLNREKVPIAVTGDA